MPKLKIQLCWSCCNGLSLYDITGLKTSENPDGYTIGFLERNDLIQLDATLDGYMSGVTGGSHSLGLGLLDFKSNIIGNYNLYPKWKINQLGELSDGIYELNYCYKFTGSDNCTNGIDRIIVTCNMDCVINKLIQEQEDIEDKCKKKEKPEPNSTLSHYLSLRDAIERAKECDDYATIQSIINHFNELNSNKCCSCN
jgi:hypothetical protein